MIYATVKGDVAAATQAMSERGIDWLAADRHPRFDETQVSIPPRLSREVREWFNEPDVRGADGMRVQGTLLFFSMP